MGRFMKANISRLSTNGYGNKCRKYWIAATMPSTTSGGDSHMGMDLSNVPNVVTASSWSYINSGIHTTQLGPAVADSGSSNTCWTCKYQNNEEILPGGKTRRL